MQSLEKHHDGKNALFKGFFLAKDAFHKGFLVYSSFFVG
uniref:Uncharacterized protein n=1 Tax=Bartonella rochalimae ATCC BAA-1498 TaxID=685782 RepID=E6YN67_9HYPH|nr:hypothetical protein BARRO_120079 [Bartonella rochalimae ATCC BAA-1498]